MVKFYKEALKRGREAPDRRRLPGARGGRAGRTFARELPVPVTGGLPQPDAAGQPRLPGRRSSAACRCWSAPGSPARCRRADRAVRRPPRATSGARSCNGRDAEAERALERWQALFGDRFYLEVQRTGRPVEEGYIAAGGGPGRAPCGAGGRDQRRALPDAPTSSRRTRRACASMTARCWPTRAACGATRESSTCARRRRWRRCSRTCPRRSRTPWRSRGAAA